MCYFLFNPDYKELTEEACTRRPRSTSRISEVSCTSSENESPSRDPDTQVKGQTEPDVKVVTPKGCEVPTKANEPPSERLQLDWV